MSQIINIKHLALLNLMNSHYKSEYLRVFGESHSFSSFVSYCHAYAKHLLVHSHFNMYDIFIDAFNRVVVQDEEYKLHEENQKEMWFGRNHEKLLIRDERIPLDKEVFRFEKDLENIIFQDFNSYYGEEKTVKRQEYLGFGKSDISINGEFAIELKIGKAKRKDVYQTFEYSFDENIKRVCLIAKEIDEDVLEIAKRLKVDCYSYSFVREEGMDSYPMGVYFEKVTNSKSNLFDEYLEDIGGVTLFSFYDPLFDFGEEMKKAIQTIDAVANLTSELNERRIEKLLVFLNENGIDTSKGFEYAANEYLKNISNNRGRR